jgi:hypothetical protein
VLSPRTERDYRQVVERWTRDGQPDPATWVGERSSEATRRNARAALIWHFRVNLGKTLEVFLSDEPDVGSFGLARDHRPVNEDVAASRPQLGRYTQRLAQAPSGVSLANARQAQPGPRAAARGRSRPGTCTPASVRYRARLAPHHAGVPAASHAPPCPASARFRRQSYVPLGSGTRVSHHAGLALRLSALSTPGLRQRTTRRRPRVFRPCRHRRLRQRGRCRVEDRHRPTASVRVAAPGSQRQEGTRRPAWVGRGVSRPNAGRWIATSRVEAVAHARHRHQEVACWLESDFGLLRPQVTSARLPEPPSAHLRTQVVAGHQCVVRCRARGHPPLPDADTCHASSPESPSIISRLSSTWPMVDASFHSEPPGYPRGCSHLPVVLPSAQKAAGLAGHGARAPKSGASLSRGGTAVSNQSRRFQMCRELARGEA